MYDVTSGVVRVDDIDVRDYDTEQLWSAIGLVPQRGYLFSGTVAENLRYGKADATDDEMWEALRVASADGFVRAHADGLDMPVAQGGINFSGGQRQRLAIARAVIRRPAIYLFDDAFSALDVHTDARVRSALGEVSADATVVIVAQRISTVADGRPDRRHRRRQGGGHRNARVAAGRLPHVRRVRGLAGGRSRHRRQSVTQPLGRPIRGMVQAPTERSRDFKGSAIRLVKRLTPQRGPTAAVILLGVGGIAIGVIGPRILGHATDLLFNGVIGRELPAGITKEQAIAAARARGDNTFADLLSGMNVVPGHGVDFAAIGRTLALALALYLVAALLLWIQARLLNVVVQRTMVALRSDVEDKLHRLPLKYFDTRQRGEVLSRVTNDVDNISTSLSMTISQLLTSLLTVVARTGDDVDDFAAADAAHGRHRAVVAVRHPRDRAPVAAVVRRAVGQHRTAQRPHRGDLQRLQPGQDIRPPGAGRGTVPRAQRATSTTPAAGRSSSRDWSGPPRPSSAT